MIREDELRLSANHNRTHMHDARRTVRGSGGDEVEEDDDDEEEEEEEMKRDLGVSILSCIWFFHVFLHSMLSAVLLCTRSSIHDTSHYT